GPVGNPVGDPVAGSRLTANAGMLASAVSLGARSGTRTMPVAGMSPSERGGAPVGSIQSSSALPGSTGAAPTAFTRRNASPRAALAISAVLPSDPASAATNGDSGTAAFCATSAIPSPSAATNANAVSRRQTPSRFHQPLS